MFSPNLRRVRPDILSVAEHFFLYDGLPHLLLVVYLREPGEVGTAGKAKERHHYHRLDPRSVLSLDEHAVYERIRSWTCSPAPSVPTVRLLVVDMGPERPRIADAAVTPP